MADKNVSLPAAGSFLSPQGIEEQVERIGLSKVEMPASRAFVLAVLAGMFVAFGGTAMLMVKSDTAFSFAASQLACGFVFTLGLFLVGAAGAELFTGNSLMLIGAASRRYKASRMLKSWAVVYAGNLLGGVLVALLVAGSGVLGSNGGAVGDVAVSVAQTKAGLSVGEAFLRGVGCNMLVCLASWVGYAGKSLTDKLFGAMLPVVVFVTAGFEHSVANLFFMPVGAIASALGFGGGATVGLAGALCNIAFVTLGNVVGGALVVGGLYWLAYGRRSKEEA